MSIYATGILSSFRRKPESSLFYGRKEGWIPACAGMTALIIALSLSHSAQASSFSDHLHINDTPQKIVPFVFEDQNGVQHALSDYRGHYLLLNVWATWCPPCVKEMPSLDTLQTRFDPHKLTVITLSEDRSLDTIAAFYRAHAVTHLPVAFDHAGMAPSALKIRGLPTTLLINAQGQEVARVEGDVDWVSADALAYLNGYLMPSAR